LIAARCFKSWRQRTMIWLFASHFQYFQAGVQHADGR
jgi:hypothetical protein